MSEFNKWVRDNFYSLYDVPTPEQAFEAGQQSQQGEVDRLQTEIDELQARVNGALKELELLNCYRTGNSDNAIDILKGNKDD